MKIHILKCWPAPFWDVVGGRKKAEFRLNDRDFKLHDRIELREFEHGQETGSWRLCEITHIQTGFGIPDGYMMLSIEAIC